MLNLKRKWNNLSLKNSVSGITLISLIITIIVMLILAGVTINLTLGKNGIFKTAQQATKNYIEAQNKDLADLNTFNNALANVIETVTKDNRLSINAKPGDYVKYTPVAKSFSMTPEQTGQDTNQDFNTKDYEGLWQVLYNDNERGLQIISVDTVGDLKLGNDNNDTKAKQGYNNLVNTLNSFCSNYVDSRYATIGRSVGSNPVTPTDATTEIFTLPFTYNGNTDSECKVADKNYETDYSAMKVATSQNITGIHNLGKIYWLASRAIYQNTIHASFYGCEVNETGTYEGKPMWACNPYNQSNKHSFLFGVRPVVTLKFNIQISKGNGSQTSPFELM